jgi:hypothetical protein
MAARYGITNPRISIVSEPAQKPKPLSTGHAGALCRVALERRSLCQKIDELPIPTPLS